MRKISTPHDRCAADRYKARTGLRMNETCLKEIGAASFCFFGLCQFFFIAHLPRPFRLQKVNLKTVLNNHVFPSKLK